MGDIFMKTLKHGDFASLAENYAKYRPGYSKTVLQVILSQSDALAAYRDDDHQQGEQNHTKTS